MRHRDFSISRKPGAAAPAGSKDRYKSLEFKHLYFQVQKLLNKRVTLALKYDSLKSPDIHCTLVKPITERLIKLADKKAVGARIARVLPAVPVAADQTPKFGPQRPTGAGGPKGPGPRYTAGDPAEDEPSECLLFILLLLRYEYLIQSENNLISFELLTTKANLCELLAIRLLKEYKSFTRINLLFIAPLNSDHFAEDSRYSFNTLELSVLSKSKRFLSQPVIIRALDKFYNGELILKSHDGSLQLVEDDSEESGLLNHDIVNYKYNKITFNNIIKRSNIVPKYQSLVINLKLLFFMMLYFILILNKDQKERGQRGDDEYDGYSDQSSISPQGYHLFLRISEASFWILGLNFNIEFLLKILNIEFILFKKIIWNYLDFILIMLINISFVMKFVNPAYFNDSFSLISIILLPRTLSVFNNYQFFNMIMVSFKKMAWNLMGLICLFFSLISGFYFSFVTLSTNLTKLDILFSMVKIFFGFTPAVWNNWKYYNNLGKGIIMGYLFLIQFIIGSMLAIVLSGVFARVNSNNHEEFNYFKTVNLILYFKVSQLNDPRKHHSGKSRSLIRTIRHSVSTRLHQILGVFKFPIILVIFAYEKVAFGRFYQERLNMGNELKNYTFLSRANDFYQDPDLINLETVHKKLDSGASPYQHEFGVIDGIDDVLDEEAMMVEDEDIDDISMLLMRSRKNSVLRQLTNGNSYGRRYSQIENGSFIRPKKMARGSKGTLRSKISTISIGGSPVNSANTNTVLEKVRTNNSETRKYSGDNGSSNTLVAKGPARSSQGDEEIVERLKRLEELLVNRISMDSFNETIQGEDSDSSIIHTQNSDSDDTF